MYATASTTRLKAARRLTKRAFRQRERAFLAEGPQAVSEALATGARVSGLFVTAPAQARHAALVEAAGRRDRGAAGQRRGDGRARADRHPAGAAGGLRVRRRAARPPGYAARCRLVAVLANVRDPGNAGTVLRTADAAGADAVIFADASVDPYNGKCVRASAGSLFHLPVVAGGRAAPDDRRARRPGLRILAADGRAGSTLDDPATASSVGADRVAVRQRGLGAPRRTAGAGRRVGGGADLRPGRVAQSRLGRGGLPVRLRASPSGPGVRLVVAPGAARRRGRDSRRAPL